MGSQVKKTYSYIVSLPDRLYPFASEIEGELVRGRRSYEHARARAVQKHGEGRVGYWLGLYRQVCHFIGSVFVIFSVTLFSESLFGSDTAMYLLLGTAIAALGYQEFFMHPRDFGQHPHKSIADWLVWVIPMFVYIFFFTP